MLTASDRIALPGKDECVEQHNEFLRRGALRSVNEELNCDFSM
jgi:hypothetical protein